LKKQTGNIAQNNDGTGSEYSKRAIELQERAARASLIGDKILLLKAAQLFEFFAEIDHA